MKSRRSVSARPGRPSPICEDCGAEVWWAWGLQGKVWTPLVPERYRLEGGPGLYEVWRDQHGGLLCKYRAPGTRGDMDQSWRGTHHNTVCGHWRDEVTAGLVREVAAAIPAINDRELLALGHRLRELGDQISAQIRRRAMEADADENE